MSAFDMHKSPRCQHVHFNGKACKAPARKGRNYCVFHQAAHFDTGAGCALPIIEDLHSYQLAIIRVARALAEDAIDPKKATALLYAIQLAGWKLNDFVGQRADIEDPDKAIGQKLLSRFIVKRAKLPVPTDKEMDELLHEVKIDRSYEPGDNIPIAPDSEDGTLDGCHPERSEGPMHSATTSNACHPERSEGRMHSAIENQKSKTDNVTPDIGECIDRSSDSRPPHDDNSNSQARAATCVPSATGDRRLITDAAS